MNKLSINLKRRTFFLLALLLVGGVASAQVTQVTIHENVYGGGRYGSVKNLTNSGGEVTIINNATVTINEGRVEGHVYGGGEGALEDNAETGIDAENAGLVEGNTTVNMRGGWVKGSVYGGGQLGSVGTFTNPVPTPNNAFSPAVELPIPTACLHNTGLATVKITGGLVGIRNQLMPTVNDPNYNPSMDMCGYVFCGGQGEVDSTRYAKANLLGVVGSTYLEISERENVTPPLIGASVYGGSENGLVLDTTHVKIAGGQIGIGHYKQNGTNLWDGPYEEWKWTEAITAVEGGEPSQINVSAARFHECDAFPYTAPYAVYDIFAGEAGYDSQGGAAIGSNGHSFFGNVFGGGSGYYPYAPGQWRRTAGQVNGDVTVEITGGHILTSVYGGNEITDVLGSVTVKMSGGTLGVPRTLADIAAHPVTCYLFGSCMGDSRTLFNAWSDVKKDVTVEVSGGTIFGSVFGGGEDGHVIGDVDLTVKENAKIGTWGYSYVDGNVFGGGRGFSGEALTAGGVGGNINVNIEGGTMLGSIYGGGRLASVGTYFVASTDPNLYGQMQDGDDHGIVTVNIKGGIIGNDFESKLHRKAHTYGGNVFGGSMGRLVQVDNHTPNEMWPDLGKVKETHVTVSETGNTKPIIKGNVYGGGEYGIVTEDANVSIQGGTVWREVFGGGRGDKDATMAGNLIVPGQNPKQVKPFQWAGRVSGNTTVEMTNGWVKKSIYGGGELGSVGTITDSIKHPDNSIISPLSWPYKMSYKGNTGLITVSVTGGRVGLTGKDFMGPWNAAGQPIYYEPIYEHGHENDPEYIIGYQETPTVYDLNTEAGKKALKEAREDNGDVFGGGKGIAGDRYMTSHVCNANNTSVTVDITSTATPTTYKPSCNNSATPDIDYVYDFYEEYDDWETYGELACIPGALYGAGENGHINEDTHVTLTDGLIGHNIYGGGKGSDTYTATLYHFTEDPEHPGSFIQGASYQAEIPSISAGKVYGNTNITMDGGYVVRSVYGGGNRASVGKGNYAGGIGDYQENGYGEQWIEGSTALENLLATSGHTYININGGTIGTDNGMKDDLPTGNVFGGSRGEPAPNVPQTLSPRIHYYPEFFLGYVNHTHVNIGQATGPGNGPRLYGSVYGGGQDGHVRWETNVVVNKGEIGNEYVSPADAITLVGTSDVLDYQWAARGSVHGAGAGLTKYKDNGVEHYSTSAGSVTQYTNVTINGGLIHKDVYGGGPMASVGPPRMGLNYDASRKQTLAKVNIYSAVGKESDVINNNYGGNVYGACRGVMRMTDPSFTYDAYGTVIYTEVNLFDGASVPGNVYGGGELGQVKQDTKVNMNGGIVGTIAYGHKNGISSGAPLDTIIHTSGGEVFGGGKGRTKAPLYPTGLVNPFLANELAHERESARVKDSTEVNIKGGQVWFNVYGGGEVASVGQHTEVHATDDPNSPVIDFIPVENTGLAVVNITGGQVGPAPKAGTEGTNTYKIPIGLNGLDGYVFGGGKGFGDDPITTTNPYGEYYQFANVNKTAVTVNMPMGNNDTLTHRIWGSVFGGAEDGHVLGSDTVHFVSGYLGTTGTTSYDGNIFGGGRNYLHKNYTAGRVAGNNTVEMTGGHIFGNIYGGGRLAVTGMSLIGLIPATGLEENHYQAVQEGDHGLAKVMVKGGKIGNNKPTSTGDWVIETFTDHSMGSVYGGGMGTMEGINLSGHPKASSLIFGMTKNTVVEISGTLEDTRIYGIVFGGGEIANVGKFTWEQEGTSISNVDVKEGLCKVSISGGTIGADRAQMRINHETGSPWLTYNDDLGYVYGGGEGLSDDPNNTELYPVVNTTRFGNQPLLNLMASAYNTEVNISGGWVKASVFGGSESGHVMNDTKVTISGGQIGAGDDGTRDLLYTDGTDGTPNQFVDPLTTTITVENSLKGTTHWDYNAPYTPFDPAYLSQGNNPTDGKSWFGNVFGGGSGWFPYVTGTGTTADPYKSHWNPISGKVWGNTEVLIIGGHILNNVYGANESTDVGGKAKVTMTGGTIGVPRTAEQILEHPIICYLFGGGCGDPRPSFDTITNVANTEVNISGGIIYGSVFGGAEDGHVLEDAVVNIENGTIGSTGVTTVDGNVFGGGRNYYAETKAPGRVGGNTTINIKGGNMLGSVFGGGRLGSVGIDVDGNMQTDSNGKTYGYTNVNIGGTTNEIIQINNITIGHSDTQIEDNRVGGNVYGGGKGIAGAPESIYPQLSQVKQATVNINQLSGKENWIKGSVFGSGEDGHVLQNTYVNIFDGQIGGLEYTTDIEALTPCTNFYHGNVYGGGRGVDTYTGSDGQQHYSLTAGHVGWNTFVNIYGGRIVRSVYGGGNLSSVGVAELETTGLATVNVLGGSVGFIDETSGDPNPNYAYRDYGNVFGSGHGMVGNDGYETYKQLAYVKNTHVTIDSVAMIYGSVFGGGEDGHVRQNTLVDVKGGVIGQQDEDFLHGNVYGGGRGIVRNDGYISPTAGEVFGHATVNIMQSNRKKTPTTYYTPEIWNNVYGGGSRSVVSEYKVVNMSAGIVHDNVFGGSRDIPAARPNKAPRWVNMWGGTIEGNLYGCSHNSIDSVGNGHADKWASFINMSGGTVRGNVFGAGYGGNIEGILIPVEEYGGVVGGSVGILIGKNAIESANLTEIGNANIHKPATIVMDSLNIFGNVYAGADMVHDSIWGEYAVSGYSNIYIDGTGYDSERITGAGSKPYMYIGSDGGGIFGSGSNCEAGKEGHNILVRNYGTRNNDGQLQTASRTLTTIQRAENLIIDHANVNLSGLADISNTANPNKYGVMRVSDTLAVINAGGIVLGSATAGGYAHMDSIYSVQSLNLLSNDSIYTHHLNELNKHSWYWVGIQDEDNSAHLYNITGTGDAAEVVGGALTFAQENVVIYNDTSKLWVRYHDKKTSDTEYKQYYGELLGFFRMRGLYYHPTLKDDESFAYARPKITDDHEFPDDNKADGGWLSYNTEFNYFTDLGDTLTYTNQYPYINVLDYTRGDREDYRMWVDKSRKRRWYVDGTRGWGNDVKKKYRDDAGLFPDKPKKTLYGKNSQGKGVGIVNENYPNSDQSYLNYSHKDDVIYVVGAISAKDEKEMLRDSTYTNDETFYPLKLYRYPGGHIMSNGERDHGGGATPTSNQWGVTGTGNHAGPGANYGAMLDVQGLEEGVEAASIEMQGVLMDGLYGYSEADSLFHEINDPSLPDASKFKPELDTLPLVLTHQNSTLTMHGHTVLKRGYNNRDAEEWYTDADYIPEVVANEPFHYHGGAIFVNPLATVNVSGLDSIVGNKQYLEIGNEKRIIDCNVYLPTFDKSLTILDSLYVETKIGVTSPVRNKNKYYIYNTLSPVAVAAKGNDNTVNAKIASDAWKSCNFLDDQGWFFVNENSPTSKRTTFYGERGEDYNTLYFGWTWANVVRKTPVGFNYSNIDSPEDLAWLISQSAGMNGQTATDFSDELISQTHDISLGQYVWVPIGDTIRSCKPFTGYFDGRGHLIDSLYIDYIGEGDSIYERHNYGMFGYVVNDTIDRTFLVGGKINPEILTADANSIGGLVGCLEGNKAVVSNSEAALDISYADNSSNAANSNVNRTSIVAGGLVGKMDSGEVYSSMAMPDMLVPDDYTGTMGGLVGISESGKINNSFTNAKFDIGENHLAFEAGGLLGRNGLRIGVESVTAAVVRNCYVTMRDTNEYNRSVDGLAATNLIKNNIGKCYAGEGLTINTANCDTDCGHFAPTMGADSLGYMYADNRVHLLNGTNDTTLFMVLNRWVYANNTTKDSTYAHWARPGLQEINGDLPVLMLCEYDYTLAHQGGFRSMGTYAGSHVLQYGGPDRDGTVHEVDSALIRPKASNKADHLFIYGDVVNRIEISGSITQSKVSIHEHASIKSAGDLAKFDATYVGVTFDNSCRGAYSTQNVNYGLVGVGGYLLPRDWHMFSTPLSDAPLGFNYFVGGVNTNETAYNGGVQGDYYNNPWSPTSREFYWIRTPGSDECGEGAANRYWMFMPDDPNLPEGQKTDGYFPTRRGSLYDGHENEVFITGTDECPEDDKYRYPYGMDFFTWYEPEYHWVNFKRNGPNHWHSDEPHDHLAYYGKDVNVNEDTLITGRGYMASISVPTFMQSHGKLNRNATESSQDVSIILTKQGANCTGWNLVGNPFHGYLDFNAFADENGLDSYVVYDADGYEDSPESAFLCYPKQGSEHGAYAGRYLHPHQAFFVLASSDSIPLNFNDAAMVAPRSDLGVGGEFDGHFRGDDLPSYPLVNLFLSSDRGCSDITVIEFERPEWGGAKKLRELRRGNGLFYGYHEEQGYAALFAKEGTTRVPLWFEAKEDDVYTIKWNTANGDFNSLYLIDNILGVQYDMLSNDTYTFEGRKQDYNARFYIVFDVTGVEEELEQDIFAFFDGSGWVVTGEGELDLVDMQGRTLWHEKLSGGQSRVSFPTLARSMYLLRLTNSRETKVQKIIVK